MTFQLTYRGTAYTVDVETLDDLQALAESYGWATMRVDMWNMTITVEEEEA